MRISGSKVGSSVKASQSLPPNGMTSPPLQYWRPYHITPHGIALDVQFLGVPWAVVSSENGYIRLVDLRDGTVQWEYQAVEHVDALLSKY